MKNEKCRNKALKTAVEVKGVTSVSLEGDDKDRVSVAGDNVDIICLANHLKKKFNSVTILSAEEVKKPKSAEEKKKEEDKKKEEENKKMIEACRSCIKCHNINCHGKCDKCTKCESSKCDGKHCVTICFKCENTKCNGNQCNSCSNCHNKKCNGCTSKPPSSSFIQYHQWWTCPK
ncbi:hypothetical protein P8452_18426 [Trifolium repens]|nr:hypothetical protein P8452_18426 [Trifolium repens]